MPFSPRGIEQSLVLPPRWPLILYMGTLYQRKVSVKNMFLQIKTKKNDQDIKQKQRRHKNYHPNYNKQLSN